MMRYLAAALGFILLAQTSARGEVDRQIYLSPISSYQLVAEPDIGAVRMSPSGAHLAAIVTPEGSESYFVATYDLDGGLHRSGAINLENLFPFWIEWVSDERLLIGVFVAGEVQGRRVRLPSTRTVAVNADGSDMVVLFSDQLRVTRKNVILSEITSLLPNDPDHVLMPAYRGSTMRLWKVNTNTGEAESVARGAHNTQTWVADRDGAPMFRIDVNRRWVTILAPDPERPNRWTRVKKIRRDRDEDVADFMPLGYSDQPGVLYVAGRPEGEDYLGIYLYDVEQRTYLSEIATHPGADVFEPIAEPGTGLAMGYAFTTERRSTMFFDPALQAHWGALQTFIGDENELTLEQISTDQRRWLLRATGPRLYGAYYIYSLEDHRADLIAIQKRTLSNLDLAPMSIVHYRASDGAELFGYLTRPVWADGPTSLVVMPHGGPAMRDVYGFDPYVQFLASRGYAVFQPQFRGSRGFGEAFMEQGYRQWGRRMQQDINDGVAHLVNAGLAEPGHVCIFGASYGGYAALVAATQSPDVYACAISMAGISDLDELLRFKSSDRNAPEEEYAYWTEVIGDRRADADAIAAASPIRYVDRVRGPVLLIHGSEDDNVPIDQSRRMRDALRAAGKDVSLVEIEGEGHSYWSVDSEAEAMGAIATFLDEHLEVY